MPKRADDVLDGGSIYWVIKGYVRARQLILGFDRVAGREGRRRCAIILDPTLLKTALLPQRPLQGWRYLDSAAVPPDLAAEGADALELPPKMAAELRDLGLI
jgi:hypothetical protein